MVYIINRYSHWCRIARLGQRATGFSILEPGHSISSQLEISNGAQNPVSSYLSGFPAKLMFGIIS